MTTITDIQKAISDLDEFLALRTAFVRSTARSLIKTLTSDPIGLAPDSIDLMELKAGIGCDTITDEKLFHAEDSEGRVGFSLRFSLGSPIVLVRWRMSISPNGVAATTHDSCEVVRTHFSASKHEAFVAELAERTLQSLLRTIKRLETESTLKLVASHPMKVVAGTP